MLFTYGTTAIKLINAHVVFTFHFIYLVYENISKEISPNKKLDTVIQPCVKFRPSPFSQG